MAKNNPITQDELDALRELISDFSAEAHAVDPKLRRDFMAPLDRVAQTMQAVSSAQHALAEIASSLAVRLALREQEAELEAKFSKQAP